MKKLTIILGLIFSAVFLWLAIKDTDLEHVGNAFADANLLAGIPLLAALVSFYWLKAMRWSDLLSPTKEIRPQALVPSMMTGAAGNNLLPAHLGELIRMYLLAHEHNVAKSRPGYSGGRAIIRHHECSGVARSCHRFYRRDPGTSNVAASTMPSILPLLCDSSPLPIV